MIISLLKPSIYWAFAVYQFLASSCGSLFLNKPGTWEMLQEQLLCVSWQLPLPLALSFSILVRWMGNVCSLTDVVLPPLLPCPPQASIGSGLPSVWNRVFPKPCWPYCLQAPDCSLFHSFLWDNRTFQGEVKKDGTENISLTVSFMQSWHRILRIHFGIGFVSLKSYHWSTDRAVL